MKLHVTNIPMILNNDLYKFFVIWSTLQCFEQCFGRLWFLEIIV